MKVAATREELVAFAQKCRAQLELPPGYNVAVVVTDESGEWVGVSGSADFSYTQRMLQSALGGDSLEFAKAATEEESGSKP